MNKTILIIIIVLIVAIGGYFLLKSGYQAPGPASAPTPAPKTGLGVAEEKKVKPEENGPEEIVGIKEFIVLGNEFSFTPSSLKVKAGDNVRIVFRNKGSIPHNLVIPELNVRTSIIGGGEEERIEFTISKPGVYTIICSIAGHREAGMEALLRVE